MSARDDGGPAFLHDRGGPYKNMWSGISVRDYFAAKTMQSMVATDPYAQHTPADWSEIPIKERIAKYSYQIADAMLKERAK